MGKATYTVTVTNNSNGVSVDYETETPMTLLVPEVAAEDKRSGEYRAFLSGAP